MDITVLKSNISDTTTFNDGMSIVLQSLKSVLPINITYQNTTFPFTSEYFKNNTIGQGYCVNPDQILSLITGNEDIVFLIFDASKMNPSPLNPVCSYIKKGNCVPCQMCSEWYLNYPATFSEFFLHEICHAMYFILGMSNSDMTHLLTNRNMDPALYDTWVRHTPSDYYLSIISSLLPAWNTYKAGQHKMQTLKKGMKNQDIATLQSNLNTIENYNLIADGSFGVLTENAVKDFQSKHNLKPIDGLAGPRTLDAVMCVIGILKAAKEQSVESQVLLAVASCEGGFYSKQINKNTDGSIDKGCFQWNNNYHPEISEAQAFDPYQAAVLAAKAIKSGKLHTYWSASQHCWAPKLSAAVRQKYGV